VKTVTQYINRQPYQHLTIQFLTGKMPFLQPNQQRQSTEGLKSFQVTHTYTQPFYSPLGFCLGLLGWADNRKVPPGR